MKNRAISEDNRKLFKTVLKLHNRNGNSRKDCSLRLRYARLLEYYSSHLSISFLYFSTFSACVIFLFVPSLSEQYALISAILDFI